MTRVRLASGNPLQLTTSGLQVQPICEAHPIGYSAFVWHDPSLLWEGFDFP